VALYMASGQQSKGCQEVQLLTHIFFSLESHDPQGWFSVPGDAKINDHTIIPSEHE